MQLLQPLWSSVVGETNLTTIFRELDDHNNVMVETAVNDNHIIYLG